MESSSRTGQVAPAQHKPYEALPNALFLYCRAVVIYHRGDLTAAFLLQQQVFALAQRALDSEPTLQTTLDVVFSLCNLGVAQRDLGALSGAQAVLQQAVALAEPPPVGPDHVLLARALTELGRVLHERGQYTDADASLQRALAMQERLLGPEHEDVSRTLTQMGASCKTQGNYRRAKGLLKRALAIAELHVVSDQYPDELCNSLNCMCPVYLGLRDYVLAQDTAERHLALVEKFKGPHHPDVALAIVQYGHVFASPRQAQRGAPNFSANAGHSRMRAWSASHKCGFSLDQCGCGST
jgi:tetratricopeptide (TPR) repeat protein